MLVHEANHDESVSSLDQLLHPQLVFLLSKKYMKVIWIIIIHNCQRESINFYSPQFESICEEKQFHDGTSIKASLVVQNSSISEMKWIIIAYEL